MSYNVIVVVQSGINGIPARVHFFSDARINDFDIVNGVYLAVKVVAVLGSDNGIPSGNRSDMAVINGIEIFVKRFLRIIVVPFPIKGDFFLPYNPACRGKSKRVVSAVISRHSQNVHRIASRVDGAEAVSGVGDGRAVTVLNLKRQSNGA